MKFNQYIDHTLLAPEATSKDVLRVINEAKENNFYSVMVNPYWVKKVHQELIGSNVKTACVIGFPLGANTTRIKLLEAEQAIADGVDELDMVMNIGEFKAGNYDAVAEEIQAIVDVGHAHKKIVKVIIEVCLLTDEEITSASKIVAHTEADYVKTSTGFSTGGATTSAVKLMSKSVLGTHTKVKASGGIRNKDDARKMIEAGASRLGVSHSLELI